MGRQHGETRHGGQGSPEYRAWQNIRQNHPDTICERWQKFESFLADVGRKPKGRFAFGLLPGNIKYGPTTAGWISRSLAIPGPPKKEVEFRGERNTLVGFAHQYRIKPTLLYDRRREGWSLERALLTPAREKKKK